MTLDEGLKQRLMFLMRIIKKEQGYLAYSVGQLFAEPFDVNQAQRLGFDQRLAETVEAFNSRFCRLQDTVGDKLLVAWLKAVGEKSGTAIDNLDKAEKLGMLKSSDQWLDLRIIRNQMVHEYIEDPALLSAAINLAHEGVSLINGFANNLMNDIERRFNL